MAGKDVKTQLNLSLNLKLGKGGRSIAQEIAQQVSKELNQAIQQAVQKNTEQIRKTTKRSAEASAKEQITADEKVQKRRIQLQRDYAIAAEAEQARVFRKSAQANAGRLRAQRAYSGAVVDEAARSRRGQLEAMLREGIQDEARQRFGSSSSPSDIAAQMRRPGDVERFAAQRVRGQEQEQKEKVRDAVRGAKDSQKKTASDDRQESKRANAEGRRVAREERQISQAERQIARLEGKGDPRFGQLNELHPGLGDRMRRAERLSNLFPGAARMARSTGLPIGLVRGGMAAAPILAGVASGNPLAGAGGGAMSGFMGGGLMGLGGMGSAALGGAGAIIGAIGAAVVMGIQRGMANVPAAVQFRRAGLGAMMVAPSQQGNIGIHRAALEHTALTQAPIGMDPMEAIQIAAEMQRAGGGFAGTASSRNAAIEAMQLRQAFGIDTGALGQLEFARRRGGIVGGAGMGAGRIGTGLVERAIGLGFQGQEIGDLVSQLAGATASARGVGTFANLGSQLGTIGALSPMIGQFQGARVAGGLQGTLSNIATQGVAGAPNPAIGLMMMQAFGGLELGKSGGVGASDIFAAQARIEREGVTPQGVKRMMGFFGQAGGGSPALQSMLMQRGLSQMGLPMGPGLIESLRRGGPANADIAATITGAAEGQRELAALQRGGIGGRASALAPVELQREAGIRGTDIQSGLVRAGLSQGLDQASANLGVMTTKLQMVNDALDMLANKLVFWTMP